MGERFVPGVSERALVEAVRARVATEQLSVMACRQPAARNARWRLNVRRDQAGVVGIEARGEDVVRDETLPLDESDPAEVSRQVAIASAEMLRPILIAWFDGAALEAPLVEAPAAKQEPEPAQTIARAERAERPLRLLLGAQAGVRLGGQHAVHAALTPELRYNHWRVRLDVDGDRWFADDDGDVRSRFQAIELGVSVGRELLTRRLWFDVGAHGRATRATLSGPVVPRVTGTDWGARVALSFVVWRNDRFEAGLTTRLSWWNRPQRLLYEGRELQHQTHIDVLAAPYLAVGLN